MNKQPMGMPGNDGMQQSEESMRKMQDMMKPENMVNMIRQMTSTPQGD